MKKYSFSEGALCVSIRLCASRVGYSDRVVEDWFGYPDYPEMIKRICLKATLNRVNLDDIHINRFKEFIDNWCFCTFPC
jgi:hypothetical protein